MDKVLFICTEEITLTLGYYADTSQGNKYRIYVKQNDTMVASLVATSASGSTTFTVSPQ